MIIKNNKLMACDNCNSPYKNWTAKQIEDVKSFTKEKLYIEHCIPADIKAKSNERITKIAAGVAMAWLGYKIVDKSLDRIERWLDNRRLRKQARELN